MFANQRYATRFVLAVLVLILPAPVYFFVVGGMVPVVLVILSPLVVLAPLYVAVEYGIARGLVTALWAVRLSSRTRDRALIGLTLALIWAAFQPIYVPVAHGCEEWRNLPRLLGLRHALRLTPTLAEAIEDDDDRAIRAALLRAKDPLALPYCGKPPVLDAARRGYADIVETLLSRAGSRGGLGALGQVYFEAYLGRHAEIARLMFEKEAALSDRLPHAGHVQWDRARGPTEVFLRTHPSELQASLRAGVVEDNVEWVRFLISRGVPPSQDIVDWGKHAPPSPVVRALLAPQSDPPDTCR